MGLALRWVTMTIASTLNRQLPARYVAGPQVNLGSIEIDVAAYDEGSGREQEKPMAVWPLRSGRAAT